MNLIMNYGLFGLTIIYHYWLVSCNPPLQDVNNRENCMCVEAEEWEGGRGIWKLSVFSVQFYVNLKILLKFLVY